MQSRWNRAASLHHRAILSQKDVPKEPGEEKGEARERSFPWQARKRTTLPASDEKNPQRRNLQIKGRDVRQKSPKQRTKRNAALGEAGVKKMSWNRRPAHIQLARQAGRKKGGTGGAGRSFGLLPSRRGVPEGAAGEKKERNWAPLLPQDDGTGKRVRREKNWK